MRGIAILVICDYRGKRGLELPATNTDEMMQLDYDIHERQNATESEIINELTALNKYLIMVCAKKSRW